MKFGYEEIGYGAETADEQIEFVKTETVAEVVQPPEWPANCAGPDKEWEMFYLIRGRD